MRSVAHTRSLYEHQESHHSSSSSKILPCGLCPGTTSFRVAGSSPPLLLAVDESYPNLYFTFHDRLSLYCLEPVQSLRYLCHVCGWGRRPVIHPTYRSSFNDWRDSEVQEGVRHFLNKPLIILYYVFCVLFHLSIDLSLKDFCELLPIDNTDFSSTPP